MSVGKVSVNDSRGQTYNPRDAQKAPIPIPSPKPILPLNAIPKWIPHDGTQASMLPPSDDNTPLPALSTPTQGTFLPPFNTQIITGIPLIHQISARLRSTFFHLPVHASWLRTNIRSLFDPTHPRSSSLQELNSLRPDVHFEGTSFTDPTHETLSSVMVSSGTNAQMIFLKNIELSNLVPFDSSGLRSWITELSGEKPASIEGITKAMSKEEASALLVLLEFVLHCESETLLPQHKRKAMRILQKISAEHHVLPPTLEVQGVEPEKHPFGGGGYSDVYKGSWNGTTVCIKRLRVYLNPERGSVEAHKEKVLQAFLKEALIWKQLKHPNILPFIGVSSTCFTNQMSLISPYMKNGDIMDYLNRTHEEPPSYAKRLGWLLGAAEGMQYIHSMNLYHGDIKGANILIDDDEKAQLADLGISSVAVSGSETLGWATATAGGVRGSLRWMSPEAILDSGPCKTTARDVYAFGSTILEVVTGRFPWANVREDTRIILNVSQGKNPDRPDGLEHDIWSIIECCWALDPVKRPSATDLLERCRLSFLAASLSHADIRDSSDSNTLLSARNMSLTFDENKGLPVARASQTELPLPNVFNTIAAPQTSYPILAPDPPSLADFQSQHPPKPSSRSPRYISVVPNTPELWEGVFLDVLQTQDRGELQALLLRADRDEILSRNRPNLVSQAIILTLVHRLSSIIAELTPKDEEFKLYLWWLSRCVFVLIPHDKVIVKFVPRILPNVLLRISLTKDRVNILANHAPRLWETARTLAEIEEELIRKGA